jgi:hypothetical protein
MQTQTIHITVEDNELNQALEMIKNLKNKIIKKITISKNYTYIDDIGDKIEIINGEEFVIETQNDLKARKNAFHDLEKGNTFSLKFL